MNTDNIKVLHRISAKGNNRRINIWLIEDDKGEHAFNITTKRLIDFKKRIITTTNNLYSVETFFAMTELMYSFLDSDEICNKLLLRDISKITKYKATSTLR